MILPDSQIKLEIEWGHIGINPFDPECIQPASVDLKLGHEFRIFPSTTKTRNFYTEIDPREPEQDFSQFCRIPDDGMAWMTLAPGEFFLGTTLEAVAIPNNMVARIEGKSSLGRLGLAIHATAGFIDPGFWGHITLELSNLNSRPIRLYPGMKIAQISFMYLCGPVEKSYGSEGLGSKYQGQEGPTASRYFDNFAERS